MKALFSLAVLFVVSLAHAWEPVLQCDNKALVIDEECQSYRFVNCFAKRRQLVINNTEIVSYFEQNGIVRSTHEGRFITDTSVVQDNNNFIVKTSANGLPVMIKVIRKDSKVTLEAYNYEERPTGHGIQLILSEKLGDWKFQNCK